MEIKVLGPGCPKCETLVNRVKKVVADLGIKADMTKVSKLADIMEYDILMTPALVVNGKVKMSGRLPGEDEVRGWISEEA